MPQSKLVAVVDDDTAILSALSSLIKSVGLDVLSFGSGETFLRSPELSSFCCLISDIHMPNGMSGIELQKVVSQRLPTLPVVLMTGQIDDVGRKRALANGAVAFMEKPIDNDLLVACLETFCCDAG